MRVIITRLAQRDQKVTEKVVRTDISVLEDLGNSTYRLFSSGGTEMISNVIKIRSFT